MAFVFISIISAWFSTIIGIPFNASSISSGGAELRHIRFMFSSSTSNVFAVLLLLYIL